MITCRELAELLIDFVAGELGQDLCEHIQHHLRACPPCVTFIETYQITIRLTRTLPRAPLPPDLERRLRAALQQGGGPS
jgi:hypothetical protein